MKICNILLLCLVAALVTSGCGGGTIENERPKLSFVEPAGDDDGADTSFVITWSDSDPDDDALISLYYDTDNTGTDGTLITAGISENSSADYYSWDTSLRMPGTYYIYAVIDDSLNDPVSRYSGSIIVSHNLVDNDPPAVTVSEPDGSGDLTSSSYVIHWTDSDPDDDAVISLYYDNDAFGNDGIVIVSGLSEDSAADSYTWDTSSVITGLYYVYAVINDNVNGPVIDYSPGQVNIWDGSVEAGAADVQLNTDSVGTYTSTDQQIACSKDKVYTVWTDYRNGSPDIYFNYSEDGGATWGGSDTRINRNSAGAAYSLNPQICADGDNVYIAWEDRRNGSYYDIYFNYSDDGGMSWQPGDTRIDTHSAGIADSRNAQLCCSGDNVYIVWQDYRNTRWEIYLNYSTDGGANFQTTDLRVDTDDNGDSKTPQVACSLSNVYITWEDTRNGSNADTFFNYVK